MVFEEVTYLQLPLISEQHLHLLFRNTNARKHRVDASDQQLLIGILARTARILMEQHRAALFEHVTHAPANDER